jgi:hypothetical protein
LHTKRIESTDELFTSHLHQTETSLIHKIILTILNSAMDYLAMAYPKLYFGVELELSVAWLYSNQPLVDPIERRPLNIAPSQEIVDATAKKIEVVPGHLLVLTAHAALSANSLAVGS